MAREQHHIDTMAYAGETPWHRLGVKADRHMTTGEALVMGGLDFEVELQSVYRYDRKGNEKLITNQYATVRTDRDADLGMVKGRYHVLQNREAFAFFDSFISNKEAHIETVGSMKGGRRIWILSRVPGDIVVNGQDVTEKYLLLSNSHDGTSGVQIKFCPIRVVCWNTLMAAIGGRGRRRGVEGKINNTYSIRHTASVSDQVAQAAKAMGIANRYYAELQEAYNAFAKVEMKQADIKAYLEKCFAAEVKSANEKNSTKSKNILAEVNRLVEEGRGADLPGVRGTLWGAYNAVTEYIDHKKYRSDDSMLDSVWFSGSGQEDKQLAFDLAVSLTR